MKFFLIFVELKISAGIDVSKKGKKKGKGKKEVRWWFLM
jgi:hypothetical protein